MSASYLKIAGELVGDAVLDSVVVTQELNHHWWCEVDCRRTEDDRFPFEEVLGKDLQVVTYDESGGEHIAFDGFVLESSLHYKIYGNFSAHIVGVTRSYKMDVAPRMTCYTTSSIQAIASEVAARSGVSVSVQADDQSDPKQFVQWGETDFSFLHRLSDDHGAWMRPSDTGIEIKSAFQASAPVQFRMELELLHFEVNGQLRSATYGGAHYDPQPMLSQTWTEVAKTPPFTGASGSIVEAIKRESSQLPPGYRYERARTPKLEEFERRLEIESTRAIGSSVVAYGISRSQNVKAGDQIEISGVIDAAGVYGLTKVIHRWTQRGYENEFWCTPWTCWVDPEPPSPVRWDGVVPARVVEHSDPEKYGRIRIRFYWQEDGDPMLWARMMTPHAGQDRGFFFRPEIGDEVVVAFEDGDPERPVILGCIWNGIDVAPTEDYWGGEYQANEVKRIVTKSGHRIQIVDKPGKESISVSTAQHLKLAMLQNADETGRSSIVLSSDNGDIILSAPNGRIHLLSATASHESG